MLILGFCGLLLTILSDVDCKPDYNYHPKVDGWLKLHKVTATWSEAFLQCHNEGAVLASPITEELLQEMKSVFGANNGTIMYLIGTHARFSPGQFVSIEGVPLDNMPRAVTNMYQTLNSQHGECLSMNLQNISVTSCTNRLPYMCYKRNLGDLGMNVTECGTYDGEYQLSKSTGSCYKFHRQYRTWPEANSLCIAEGGHLVILNDNNEARIVKDIVSNARPSFNWPGEWSPLFLGLRDWDGNGTWMSIHGEPINQLYNEWQQGQPDALKQYCGAMIRNGKMDNNFCNIKSFFVCEKDPDHIRFLYGDQTAVF